MKKNHRGLLFVFCLPLLMGNSPAPNPYPKEYIDFELTNGEMEVIEVEDSKELVFRGDLKNVGTGLIDLEYSYISYRFERTTYNLEFFDYDVPEICDAIPPSQTYHYEKSFPYQGTTPTGIVEQYIAPTLGIFGFSSEDFMSDIVINDIAISNRVYDAIDDVTTSKLSFAWNNSGDRSGYSFYFSFSIGTTQYVKYLTEELPKNENGTAEVDFVVPGNITEQNIENISITYLPINSYYDNDHFGIVEILIILLVIGGVIVFAPIITLIVIMIIRAVKKRKTI